MKSNNQGLVCPYIVKFVTFENTRLIDQNEQYHNSYKVYDALVIARNHNLNLVCFNKPEGNNQAFCKIIDFNKWQYSEEKRKKKQQLESRRETKEIRLSPNIADNDIDHKMRQANEILEEGNEIVLVMKLKGRDRLHMNEAELRINEILKKCDKGKEVSRKKSENMIVVRLNKIGKTENKTEEKKT